MLDKSNEEINSKISEIDTELDEIKSIYKTQITNHKSQITNDFTLYKSDLDDLKDNISSDAINQIQTRLVSIEQDSIRRQTKQYSERLNTLKETQNGALEKFNGEVDDQIDNISNRINKEINEFETKKTEITQILGEISAAYQAGANTRQAKKENISAEILRVLGIIWMIATIFITMKLFNDYIGFYEIPSERIIPNLRELGIEWFAIRFMTILMLTSPGIYLLKESAAHRTKENLYRQRGTQLSSIGLILTSYNQTSGRLLKRN